MQIFKSNENLFFWGPIGGRPIYVSYFMESIAKRSHKIYQYRWPKFIFAFIDGKMTFVCNNDGLVAQGKKYFNNWIMDDIKFTETKDKYKSALLDLRNIEEKITELDKLTDSELASLYLDFHEKYLTFWDHGLVPEIANWGGEVLLKDSLKNLSAGDFTVVYEKLSAPSGLSFYQEEELDLLKVKKGENSIDEHRRKYFWINNSYLDSLILTNKFFQDRLAEFDKSEVDQEINRINNFIFNSEKEKENYIKKYNLSKDIKKISERLSYCIYWQDERKGNIFKANHYIKLFLEEFSRRYLIPLAYLEQYWCWELPNLLKGIKVDEKKMKNRLLKQAGFMVADEEKNLVITADEFEFMIKPILEVKVNKEMSEVKGISVSTGKGLVKGKVKILLNPHDFDKMQAGDILLAPMTSPEYILALRKAIAVVTDTGGMTCHAAIVSRELGIPCIVGTKIATKIFKDGDLVEVDASKGVVKKLN